MAWQRNKKCRLLWNTTRAKQENETERSSGNHESTMEARVTRFNKMPLTEASFTTEYLIADLCVLDAFEIEKI